jgi:hypothetical protein
LLGIPADLAQSADTSLVQREQRVQALRRTKAARWLAKILGESDQANSGPHPTKGGDIPLPGPLLDREVEEALALLGSMAFQEIQRRGWHVQPNHFYWPLNDLAFLRENSELWTVPTVPKGIDWDLDGQAKLAERLASYADELADVRREPMTRPGEFVWGMGFRGFDVYSYYGLLRDLKPSGVIEVGVGQSSILMRRALEVNGNPCSVTLIDPRVPTNVVGELPQAWEVHHSLVQNVDPDVFTKLGPGDILFYDGSHCVRTGSDVNWMFFEVLPRLSPGVWIHVHDISWPRDYGAEWIMNEGLSWNEQYLVQAFLMHNASYRVRLASVMLHHSRGRWLEELFPTDLGGASSLWLEKVS